MTEKVDPNPTNAIISWTISWTILWYDLPTNYPTNNRISWIWMRKKIGLKMAV